MPLSTARRLSMLGRYCCTGACAACTRFPVRIRVAAAWRPRSVGNVVLLFTLPLRHVADGRPRVVQAVRGAMEWVWPGAAAHAYSEVHSLPWALLSIVLSPWEQQAVASHGRVLCEWSIAHVESLLKRTFLHRTLPLSLAGEVLLRQPGSLHGIQRRRAVSHRVAQPSPPTRTHARGHGLATCRRVAFLCALEVRGVEPSVRCVQVRSERAARLGAHGAHVGAPRLCPPQ